MGTLHILLPEPYNSDTASQQAQAAIFTPTGKELTIGRVKLRKAVDALRDNQLPRNLHENLVIEIKMRGTTVQLVERDGITVFFERKQDGGDRTQPTNTRSRFNVTKPS